MTPEQLDRIKPALVCPKCRNDLDFSPDRAVCSGCGAEYAIQDGKIFFIDSAAADDELDSIKSYFKYKFGRAYYTILKPLIAPSLPIGYGRYLRRNTDPSAEIVIDIGSGNYRALEGVYTLDATAYEATDIVCDVNKMPFRDGSIDVFSSNSLLEHVADLNDAIAELRRVTSPGGRNIHMLPFMYPFHAAPNDFQRLTHVGLRNLFRGWDLQEQYNTSGPFTLFNVMFTEVFSIMLSFGNKKLQAFLYLFACTIVCPLKFLDLPFVRRDSWLTIAPGIMTHVRKPDERDGAGT